MHPGRHPAEAALEDALIYSRDRLRRVVYLCFLRNTEFT
jgi:hypothetical protein